MFRLIFLALLQSICLAGGQVLLKFALIRMGSFSWSRTFFVTLLTNWWFMACGICFGIASLLWMYIVKNFPLSMAYPMVSMSYVFGMIAAIVFFHEHVTIIRWLGVLLIMIGCCLTSTAQEQRLLSAQEQEAVIQRISKTVAGINTMQCDFTQTKQLSLLKEVAASHGIMHYEQGNRLHWEYTSPTSYIFVLKDDHVTIKSANRKSVIDVRRNKVFQEITRIMVSSITGECLRNSSYYTAKFYTTAYGNLTAILTPQKKELRQMFKAIHLHFNKARDMVSSIKMIEDKGDVTTIEMHDIKINQPLDESVFSVD